MAIVHLPPDFKEFLQLFNSRQVEYLLIGGYAVGYYGYPRATADMDIWIAIRRENAEKVVEVLLMVFPLGYLLLKAPANNRPGLYYIQVGLMLAWLLLLFFVDYVFRIDFRQTRWMVITFVVLYFGGMGGMIGVAAQAGRGWAISAIILFLIAGFLAFVQRAVTGL